MAGFPFSGKSTFIKKFLSTTKHKIIVIDPKEWIPEDIDTYDKNTQKDYRITAWQLCLEQANDCLRNHNNIIIFDTAGASIEPLFNLFTNAKVLGHTTVYIYVSARVNECMQRAKEKWIGEDAVQKYISKFKQSVPEFTKISDIIMTVINKTEYNNIDKSINKLESIITKHAKAS